MIQMNSVRLDDGSVSWFISFERYISYIYQLCWQIPFIKNPGSKARLVAFRCYSTIYCI